MKHLRLNSAWMLLVFTLSVSAPATLAGGEGDYHAKRKQYKLLDLGTLGGPSSLIFGGTNPINSSGMVLMEEADTELRTRSSRTRIPTSARILSFSMQRSGSGVERTIWTGLLAAWQAAVKRSMITA